MKTFSSTAVKIFIEDKTRKEYNNKIAIRKLVGGMAIQLAQCNYTVVTFPTSHEVVC